MAVFPTRMRRLDYRDTAGSFALIEEYIRYMVERIEYLHSSQREASAVDGILEKGTISGWTYEKRATRTDAWYVASLSVSGKTWSGTQAIPSGIFDTPPTSVVVTPKSKVMYAEAEATSETSIKINIGRDTSASATISVALHVIG